MGGKQSHVVNPNNPNTNNQQSNQNANSNNQLINVIKDAFRNCSKNGALTKDGFNQALSILEAFQFKRLRDTPLAERLFYIFDKNNSGTIMEEEFIRGIGEIVNDKEAAINYTFKAYDRDRDNNISRKQFMQFIEQSWRAAFRLISQNLEANGGIRIQDIEGWSSSKVSALNEQSSSIFNGISKGRDIVDYQTFKAFILKGDPNQIKVQLDNRQVSVPLNLLNLNLH